MLCIYCSPIAMISVATLIRYLKHVNVFFTPIARTGYSIEYDTRIVFNAVTNLKLSLHSLSLPSLSYVLSIFFGLSYSFLTFFSWRLVFSLVSSSATPRIRGVRTCCSNQTSAFSSLNKPSPWLIFFEGVNDNHEFLSSSDCQEVRIFLSVLFLR